MVLLQVDEAPPTGWLADRIAEVDRAFWLAARFAKSGLEVEEFVSRRRRGIPVKDGLQVGAIEVGSLRFRLKPSKRMRKHIKKHGLAELALVIAILNGTVDLAHKVIPGDTAPEPTVYAVPTWQPPTDTIEIVVVRDGEREQVRLRAHGGAYRVIEPPPQPRRLPR